MTLDQLNPQELRLIELVRVLPESAAREVADFAAFKAARAATWSYDDPDSLVAAVDRMAKDPDLLREMGEIERDFAPTLNDGLENY